MNQKRRVRVNLEIKFTYRDNDSNLDELTPGSDSKDYHKRVYAVGLTTNF